MNFWRWSSFGDSCKFLSHIFRYAKQRSSEADLGRKQRFSTYVLFFGVFFLFPTCPTERTRKPGIGERVADLTSSSVGMRVRIANSEILTGTTGTSTEMGLLSSSIAACCHTPYLGHETRQISKWVKPSSYPHWRPATDTAEKKTQAHQKKILMNQSIILGALLASNFKPLFSGDWETTQLWWPPKKTHRWCSSYKMSWQAAMPSWWYYYYDCSSSKLVFLPSWEPS